MKKGDVRTTFFLVLSMIIIGAILIFGFRAIAGTQKTLSDTKNSDFYIALKNELLRIRSSYAEVKKYEFSSDKITKVCFFDKDFFRTNNPDKVKTVINDPLIYDAVSTGSDNIFFMVGKNIEKSDLVDGITLEEGYLCIPSPDGRLRLTLEGMKNNRVGVYPES